MGLTECEGLELALELLAWGGQANGATWGC